MTLAILRPAGAEISVPAGARAGSSINTGARANAGSTEEEEEIMTKSRSTKGAARMIGSHKNRKLVIRDGCSHEEITPRNRKERRALEAIKRKNKAL